MGSSSEVMFGRDLLLVVAEAVRATMEGRTSVVSWRATALVPSCIFRSMGWGGGGGICVNYLCENMQQGCTNWSSLTTTINININNYSNKPKVNSPCPLSKPSLHHFVYSHP